MKIDLCKEKDGNLKIEKRKRTSACSLSFFDIFNSSLLELKTKLEPQKYHKHSVEPPY